MSGVFVRWCVLMTALSLGAGCASDPAQTEPVSGVFSVLTYNVAGLPEGISGSNPEANMPVISPLLNDYDLAFVQEDFWYHEALIQSAQHPYQSDPKEKHKTVVDDGLNHFSIFPFSNFERHQWVACFGTLDNSNDCLAEKGFSVATFAIAPGVEVDVYNHHAEAGGGPEDNAAREAGFAQLSEFMTTHSAGKAVIVAGDTNLHGFDPTDEPVLAAFMAAQDLTDSCRSLDCGEESIDRVLHRSSDALSLKAVFWERPPQFVDAEGGPLSDHFPVHVRIEWQWTQP